VRKSICNFIENTKLNLFSCTDIKRLDAQLLSEILDRETFDLFSKGWGIKSSYEMFTRNGIVHRFDLKVTLLLFSKDTFDNKMYLLKDLITDSPRKMMQFLEWRYKLINDKIPLEMHKAKIIEGKDAKEWIDSARLKAGYDIVSTYKMIQTDKRMINSLNLLFI
jgi:hypothetical protein